MSRVEKFLAPLVVLVALAVAMPRTVYSQAQALLYGSYSNAAKAVAVDSTGRLKVSLGAGTVGVANGGTGLATLTAHNVLIGNGTSAVTLVPGGTDCYLHWATSSVDPTCASATAGAPGGATNTIQYNAGSSTFGGVALNATATVMYLKQVSSGVAAFAQVAVADLSGFAANVAAWLATPSSANLASALTDETGSGLAVFGTSPTIVTPTIASFTNATHDHSNAAGGGVIRTLGAFPITTSSVTSGGIPYFSSTTAMASSALLGANALTVGGGAGTAPFTDGNWTIEQTGHTLSSTTQPRAEVSNSGTEAISSGTSTAITFDTNTTVVPSTIHSTASNQSRIVIPTGAGGFYMFSAGGQFASSAAGSTRFIFFRKNGTTGVCSYQGGPGFSAGATMALSVSCGVTLVAGDYMELMAFQDTGGNLNFGNGSGTLGSGGAAYLSAAKIF